MTQTILIICTLYLIAGLDSILAFVTMGYLISYNNNQNISAIYNYERYKNMPIDVIRNNVKKTFHLDVIMGQNTLLDGTL